MLRDSVQNLWDNLPVPPEWKAGQLQGIEYWRDHSDHYGLTVGELAPDFCLEDAFGNQVSLAERCQKGPVAITFYRGEWCPVCNMELQAIQDTLAGIRAAGGSVLAIGPQNADKGQKLFEKMGLDFEILCDPTQEVIRNYNIQIEIPDFIQEIHNFLPGETADGSYKLPIPATFILDRKGVVRVSYVDVDWRNRLEPLSILKSINTMAYFEAIFMSAPSALVILDENGHVIDMNPAGEALFSAIQHDIRTGSELLTIDPLNKTHDNIQLVLKGEQKYWEWRNMPIMRESLATKIVNFNISQLVINGETLGAVCAFEDITQQEMQRLALEETLHRLQTTQNQLVQSEKMAALGQLVSGVAHEINTPVGVGVTAISHLNDETHSVLQRAEMGKLSKKDFDQFLDTCKSSTDLIRSNLEQASNLVIAFKQVAVDQASENKRLFSVKKYLHDLLLSRSADLVGWDIELLGQDDIQLMSYPGAFAQILTQVINNVLTHAYPPEAKGRLRITLQQEEECLVLRLQDWGKGVSQDTLNQVFDPFFTTTRGSGHPGLGLHIVYNVVTTMLAGSISADSPDDGGFILSIRIPILPN